MPESSVRFVRKYHESFEGSWRQLHNRQSTGGSGRVDCHCARALHGNGPGTDLQQTRHMTATHSCMTSPRTRKLRTRCVATVHARTQRKHFHRIVAWRVCWNAPTGPLPSSGLSKSIAVYLKVLSFASRNWWPSSLKSHSHLLRVSSLHDFSV
jgi:hypothetical protein